MCILQCFTSLFCLPFHIIDPIVIQIKQITKHANLVQMDNGKKVSNNTSFFCFLVYELLLCLIRFQIPLSGWTCEAEGCTLGENLWLNLTDGAIRCGRSQFVAEGQMCKGNNHMKQYYDATGYCSVLEFYSCYEYAILQFQAFHWQ